MNANNTAGKIDYGKVAYDVYCGERGWTACQATSTASPVATSNNLQRLMSLPDAAHVNAPIFTRDALNTVNDLEAEIKKLKVAR
jgi:hypothetical protein